MGIRSAALFLDLLADLDPWLYGFERDLALRGEKLDLIRDLGESVQRVAARSLVNSFLKKFEDEPNDDAEHVALTKFLDCNDKCQSWNFTTDHMASSEAAFYQEAFGSLKEELRAFWQGGGRYSTDWNHSSPWTLADSLSIARYGRAGPGSSLGATGCDFYSKMFSSKLTCTKSALYSIYCTGIESDPNFLAAEWYREQSYGRFDVVEGSRLSFVPKQKETARVICTEPSLNMWLQLGLGRLMEERLSSAYGLDLARQPTRNHELARQGSLDGSFGTIDLSSASDTVSLRLLEQILPAEMLTWISLLRSERTTLPSGEVVPLHMVSSMGNGFTFPLETLVFACSVRAIYRCLGIPLRNPGRRLRNPLGGYLGDGRRTEHYSVGNWGVFGDDIIVSRQAYDYVITFLTLLGFDANRTKSYNVGPFRESCGRDFCRGYDVRGVYLKTLKTQESRYSAINRLLRWSARHGLPLIRTVQHLIRTVKYLPVPPYEADDCGIKVPLSIARCGLLRSRNGSYLYECRVPRPQVLRIGDGTITVPYGSKKRAYNGYGLLVAVLHGSIGTRRLAGRNAQQTLTIRHDRATYESRRRVAPGWDYIGAEHSEVNPSLDLRTWTRFVWAALVR